MRYAAALLLALSTCAAPLPAQTPPNMEAKPYELVELIPVLKDGMPAIVYFNGETYGGGVDFVFHVNVPDVGIVTVQIHRTKNDSMTTGDTATVIGVPMGWRVEPVIAAVPEGGRETFYLIPDGLS